MKKVQKLPVTGPWGAVFKIINDLIDNQRELELKNSPEVKINRTRNGSTVQPTRRATPGDGSGENQPAVWQ